MAKFWNEENTAKAVELYDGGNGQEVEAIADALGTTKRSVIGKLVREGKYVAPEKPTPAKRDEGPTKGELLTTLSKMDYDVTGLDNATKDAIKNVIALVETSKAE